MLFLKITACAAAGAVCFFPCEKIIFLLLKARECECVFSKKERILLVISMALAGAAIGGFAEGTIHIVYLLLLLCALFTVSVCDIHHRIIPNEAVLSLFVFKLIFGVPSLFGAKEFEPFDVLMSFIGLAACMIAFSLPALFKKNVGAGDIKLAGAIGFCLGITNAMFAIVIMGVLILGYSFMQRRVPILTFLKEMLPMGPFIAVGTMAALLFPFTLA